MNYGTGNRPQYGRNKAASTPCVLKNSEGKVVKQWLQKKPVRDVKPVYKDYSKREPIINSDGQTHSEWIADLRKREMEETFGALGEFAADGLGYVLTGTFGLLVGVLGVFVSLVKAGCDPGPKRHRPVRHTDFPRRSRNHRGNVNVNVNVKADRGSTVNVNVNVNQ